MWPLLLQVSSLVNCHVGAPVMPARGRAMTVPSLVGDLPAPQESLPLPCPPQAAADLPLSLHFLEWEHHVLLPSSPCLPQRVTPETRPRCHTARGLPSCRRVARAPGHALRVH